MNDNTKKNLDKTANVFGDFIKEVFDVKGLWTDQRVNWKDNDYYRDKFQEDATDYELRLFAIPDCGFCGGHGWFDDEEGDHTIPNGINKIRVTCCCLGSLDDEGLIKYQKNKMKGIK